MYVPRVEEIKTVPRFASFYRPEPGTDLLIAQIADRARNAAGKDDSYRWRTIRAIAASPWNRSHIEYGTRFYENYNIEGPQWLKKCGPDPLAQPGTGNLYPVLWIPDPDSALEPDQVFAPVV